VALPAALRGVLAAQTMLNAAVSYYGVGIQKALSEANGIRVPLLLHIATEDQLCPPPAQQEIGRVLGVDINIVCHLISAGKREPTIGAHVTLWCLISISSPPVMAYRIINFSGPKHFNSGCRHLSSYQ
jgi:hypothetical protein